MWQPIETAPKDQPFLAVLNCAGEQTICTMRWAVAEAKNSRPDHYVFHVERVTHWMPLPALPGAQAQPAPSVPDGWKEGVESAARLIDMKADLYSTRFGHDDMGGLSFGTGAHAEIKMDHYTSLLELADEVRAMLASAPKPEGE